MILNRVQDLNADELLNREYDLGLFASGYERRCTHLARQFSRSQFRQHVVLGFEEVDKAPQRHENDRFFSDTWSEPIPLSADDDTVVYETLRTALGQGRASVRILVDYSSMSRLWYAAVLNWSRFFRGPREITVDLVYAVGDHKGESPPTVIKEIVSVPACEGLSRPLSKSVAVFGLGFEGLAALCVFDRLEPHELHCYLAAPAAFHDYPSRARAANLELIRLANSCVSLPLNSVERCFSMLSEIVSPHRFDAHVTLVPMGPKPHVLASILLAMRFKELTCLRVAYRRHKPEDVGTTGDIVRTRIEFTPGPPAAERE